MTAQTFVNAESNLSVRTKINSAICQSFSKSFSQYELAPGNAATTQANYARSKAAYARVVAGTANMKIGLIGDSTQMGAYALNVASLNGCRPASHTTFFSAAMNQPNAPAIEAGWCGDSNVVLNSGTLPLYDPRVAFSTTDWASTLLVTAGGHLVANSVASSTATMKFLPFEPVDTCENYFAVSSGLTSFTVSRTGDTTSGVQSTVGTPGVGKFVFSGALGNVNPFTITPSGTGGGIYMMAQLAYNSASKSVLCTNIGWSGGKMSDWVDSTSSGWAPLLGVQALGLDLVVLTTGVNEWFNSVNVATYQANLDTYVSALLVNSDVVLCTGYPSQNTTSTLAVQLPYITAIKAVAAKYNLYVNDVWSKWQSWEKINPLGLYGNNLHPNKGGYQIKAEGDAAMVLALVSQ